MRAPALIQSRNAQLPAGVLAIAAGVVHAAAAGSHGDSGDLRTLLVLVAAQQVAVGVAALTWPTATGRALGTAVCGGAVTAWLATRIVGLPWPEELAEAQPVGVQDVAAASLGAGAALAWWWHGRGVHTPRQLDRVAAIAVTVAAVVGVVGVTAPHDHGGPSAEDQSVNILEAGVRSDRLPLDEAIALLGLSARPVLGSGDGHDHDHSAEGGHGSGYEEPPPPKELSGDQQAAFDLQWDEAVGAAVTLRTEEAAAAAGYVQAGTDVPGVGTHWVKWSLVDRPFDPGAPSMLLFTTVTAGRPAELVGLSYWVASEDEPEGFVGPNDRWHSHHGLCFVNGWLRDEGLERRADCPDTWIDGRDLWMLHAWAAPTVTNPWGSFADINPRLCTPRPQVPDALSCDPVGR